jgi:hypothetical protein
MSYVRMETHQQYYSTSAELNHCSGRPEDYGAVLPLFVCFYMTFSHHACIKEEERKKSMLFPTAFVPMPPGTVFSKEN